ncbi:hypothetical protein COOONC_21400, partial [Cooperia oncophora]
ESYREGTGDTFPIYHPSDHFGGDSDPLDLNTVNRYSAAVSSAYCFSRRYIIVPGKHTQVELARDSRLLLRKIRLIGIQILGMGARPTGTRLLRMVGATTMPVPPPPPPPVGGFPAPPPPTSTSTTSRPVSSGTFCARAVCTALTTSGRARQVQQPSRATVQNHGRPTRF